MLKNCHIGEVKIKNIQCGEVNLKKNLDEKFKSAFRILISSMIDRLISIGTFGKSP